MVGGVDERFFLALREAVAELLGSDHACALAAARAAGDGEPGHAAAVQDELQRLDPAITARLMERVHRALREDPAAILAQWRGGPLNG